MAWLEFPKHRGFASLLAKALELFTLDQAGSPLGGSGTW
jgi:hypothetical protein